MTIDQEDILAHKQSLQYHNGLYSAIIKEIFGADGDPDSVRYNRALHPMPQASGKCSSPSGRPTWDSVFAVPSHPLEAWSSPQQLQQLTIVELDTIGAPMRALLE